MNNKQREWEEKIYDTLYRLVEDKAITRLQAKKEISVFISQIEAKAEERVRGEIVEMIKGIRKVPFSGHVGNDTEKAYEFGEKVGFNSALDSLLSRLQDKELKK